jgi:hypothetical protein
LGVDNRGVNICNNALEIKTDAPAGVHPWAW